MVLAQANRKHRYVSSPPNECVNIVALILYAVSALLFFASLSLRNGGNETGRRVVRANGCKQWTDDQLSEPIQCQTNDWKTD